ncbi:MAG: hypothetical protein J7M18_05140 [Candidatus Eremiobacteraeota bacterium]|nr:hypothetical protein [Candidatus Eremiobacteraeota bacterium]
MFHLTPVVFTYPTTLPIPVIPTPVPTYPSPSRAESIISRSLICLKMLLICRAIQEAEGDDLPGDGMKILCSVEYNNTGCHE